MSQKNLIAAAADEEIPTFESLSDILRLLVTKLEAVDTFKVTLEYIIPDLVVATTGKVSKYTGIKIQALQILEMEAL